MDKNKNAVSIFNKYATEYQNKFMDVNLYADSFDFFCENIPVGNSEILELACGPGNITNYLLSKRPDFKIFGIDLSPNMIALAKINNPDADFQIMDCREIIRIEKKYDAIMCGFCLPYLSKEESIQLINDASKILNPEGLIYISTMEDDYSKSGFKKGSTGDEIYMHFHQANYLSDAITSSDLNLLKLERKESVNPDGSLTIDLILIARLKTDSICP